jgi:protein tyrosine/serine phosphatase
MRNRKFQLALAALALPVGLLLYLGLLQIAGNFHTVEAGTLYRSAQPSGSDIKAYARTLGLKSVINLRGRHPGEPWYDDELRASNELGLFHADLALSATRELTGTQLQDLRRMLRDAPAPVLIHCKGGADRTGLAAALYVLEVLHRPIEAAAGQLSWIYGHWPYFWSRSGAMDRSFEQAAGQHAAPGPAANHAAAGALP